MLSPNVSVVSTTGTTERDRVTLQCEDGLSLEISCNRSGAWSPNPAEFLCNTPQGEFNYVRIMFIRMCARTIISHIILPVSAKN